MGAVLVTFIVNVGKHFPDKHNEQKNEHNRIKKDDVIRR